MAYLSKINLDGTARNLKDAEAFSTRDSAETAIANDDTFPFYDASASGKKKSTYSNLFSKLRTSLGSMTAAQLKAGTDTTIRGMRADYAKNGIRQIIGEAAGNDTIETLGSKPSKAYKLGEYFLANDGYWYVTTAAISTSTNISSGSNCSKTSIAASFENLRSELIAEDLGLNYGDGSSISTTNGSIYSGWSIQFTIFTDNRSSYPHGATICRSCDVRMSSVTSRPTVTITNNKLKNYGDFNGKLITYRYSGATQYPCDGGGYGHTAGSNQLTLTSNAFASTGPNGYWQFLK